jgi:hypothetical protein
MFWKLSSFWDENSGIFFVSNILSTNGQELKIMLMKIWILIFISEETK